jgi:hypothetical protein
MLIDADELRKVIAKNRRVDYRAADEKYDFVHAKILLAELDRLEREAQGGG